VLTVGSTGLGESRASLRAYNAHRIRERTHSLSFASLACRSQRLNWSLFTWNERIMTLFIHGAGLSTAAGISDYTDPDSISLSLDDVRGLKLARIKQWAKRHCHLLACVGNAKPTPAHATIASYVRSHREAGIPAAIWTQNVDGLEREALGETSDLMEGKLAVLLEMHGSLMRARRWAGVRRVDRADLTAFSTRSPAVAYWQAFGPGVPDVVLTQMRLKHFPLSEKTAKLFDELVLVGTTGRTTWVRDLVTAFIERKKRIRVFNATNPFDFPGVEFTPGDINQTTREAFGP
jgi:NAD-dependent SIR2 family protein deacetylase